MDNHGLHDGRRCASGPSASPPVTPGSPHSFNKHTTTTNNNNNHYSEFTISSLDLYEDESSTPNSSTEGSKSLALSSDSQGALSYSNGSEHEVGGPDSVGDDTRLLADLLFPYVIEMDDVMHQHFNIEQYTTAHVVQNKIAAGILYHNQEVLICKIDLLKMPVSKLWIHFVRVLHEMIKQIGFAAIFPGQPFMNYLLPVGKAIEDNSTELMEMFNACHLELRATVKKQKIHCTDQRPSFDRSEQIHRNSIFRLRPFIQYADPVTGVYHKILDPLGFGLESWSAQPSGLEKFFSLPVPFRDMYVSTPMLLEMYNRRTILAGLDNPSLAMARMTEILERSPIFTDNIHYHFQSGYSIMQDTRSLAVAMATGQPWLTNTPF
jgi:hypothetical protein